MNDLVDRLMVGLKTGRWASRSVRIAGGGNFKSRYKPDFPTVKLIAVQPGRIVTDVGELKQMLGPPTEQNWTTPGGPAPLVRRHRTEGGWPDYQRCLRGAPLKRDGRPDRSACDFLWAKWAIERGHSEAEVEEELRRVSAKARERERRKDTGYAKLTVQKAAAAAI
jgi:hypothetical protein